MFNKNIRIETERLILRPFAEGDSDAMFEIQSNSIMTKYTPDEPWKSIEDAKEFIKLAGYMTLTSIPFAISLLLSKKKVIS